MSKWEGYYLTQDDKKLTVVAGGLHQDPKSFTEEERVEVAKGLRRKYQEKAIKLLGKLHGLHNIIEFCCLRSRDHLSCEGCKQKELCDLLIQVDWFLMEFSDVKYNNSYDGEDVVEEMRFEKIMGFD